MTHSFKVKILDTGVSAEDLKQELIDLLATDLGEEAEVTILEE